VHGFGNGWGAFFWVNVGGKNLVVLGFVIVELGELFGVDAEFGLFFGGGVDVGVHYFEFVAEICVLFVVHDCVLLVK